MHWVWKLGWPIATVALLAMTTVPAEEPGPKQSGVFAGLRVGQTVTLKDEGSGFSISFFERAVPLTHRITEVRENSIVLQDVVGIVETTVPVYSLKSIAKVRERIK